MTRRLRLGLLTRVYAPDASPRVLHETLELIEAAEALGFDSAWVAQHHFGRETGRLPAPLVLLAAAARRTRRIALGTGVIVLPLEHPLRVAEDAAVLDALSGGRVQLGLGAGFEPDVFGAFGRDFGARAALQDAALGTLQSALAGTPLDRSPTAGSASAAPSRDTEPTLQPPAPGLAQRIWLATGDVDAAVRHRTGLIVARSRSHEGGEASLIERYRSAWQHTHAPRVALVRAVIPGSDARSVEAALAPDILRYASRLAQAGSGAPTATPDAGALLDTFGVLRGETESIAASLRADAALPIADDLIVQVQTFSTSHADAIRRIEAVAREIAPALDWRAASASEQATSVAAHLSTP
ncbi:Bac_luciferase domain-containing protein [Paraburkholderia tropica]|uniref:LLM class flavin-dependent oxidoreductase n=1 Tax=Paraburkholderia tropica TaxID=92647 RepID=UPI001CB4598D|nr:LLM class flavin-dependent oxidoreductase [Paraburkholderia tropica]CAG9202575.1 Bac_luciferase domain-containing protein [Paraburkholderia tropica]